MGISIDDLKRGLDAADESRLLDAVQAHLAKLSGEDRVGFIAECMENYCEICGSEHLPCYCASSYDE